MSTRSCLPWLSYLLLIGACDRYYPLGTAGDASAPTATGGASGGVTGGATGGTSGPGGPAPVTGGSAGNPAGEATGGMPMPPPEPPAGLGGASGVDSCPTAGRSLPERPLAISPAEVAERLAVRFWSTEPDQALLDRAAQAKTNLDVKRLALSVLADPRARVAVDNLTHRWLGLQSAATYAGADEVQGTIDNLLRASMVTETETFMRELFITGDGSLSTLLLAPYSFIDERLAKVYGVAPAGTFARVDLPKEERSGILTQASFLFSKPRISSRGTWLSSKLLCYDIPSPPSNTTAPLEAQPGETGRQALERNASATVCHACHQLIDPPGFAFEHYDALGRYRALDNGKPIDVSGFLNQTTPGPIKFDGVRQLGQELLSSCTVQRCMARVFLEEFSLLRGPAAADEALLDEMTAEFVASGLNLRELFAAAAASRPALAP